MNQFTAKFTGGTAKVERILNAAKLKFATNATMSGSFNATEVIVPRVHGGGCSQVNKLIQDLLDGFPDKYPQIHDNLVKARNSKQYQLDPK